MMLTQVLGSQVTPGFLGDVMSYNSLTGLNMSRFFCPGFDREQGGFGHVRTGGHLLRDRQDNHQYV